MKRVFGVFVAGAAIVILGACGDSFVGGTKTVTILATSDLHGRLYPYEYALDSEVEAGLAKVATIVEQERVLNEDLIVIDNGDAIESNLISLFNTDEYDMNPMIEAMNMIGYDAWTLGNHEFNFGLDILNKNIDAFNGAVLGGNIKKTDGSDFVDPYTIIEQDGVSIAIVGLTAPYIDIWEAGTPEHYTGLEFLDPAVVAQDIIDEINLEHPEVDLVIGSFHMGLDSEEMKEGYNDGVEYIAENVDGFDAIVAGHAHAAFGAADNQKIINDTIIVEPGSYGSYVAKLEFEMKEEKEGEYSIQSGYSDLLSVNGVEASQEILTEMKYVDEVSKAKAYSKIGEATGDFLPEEDFVGVPIAQTQDTALVDLINEVQLYYSGADVAATAFMDSNADLKAGEIQFKDAALIYKYDNTLQSYEITGAQLKAYMEWSVSFYNTSKNGDVFVSFDENIRGYNYDMFAGINYDIDLSKDAGNRITNLVFKGEELQDDDTIVLAINNYRAGTLKTLGILDADATPIYDSTTAPANQIKIQDQICDYIENVKGGTISPSTDNNWRIINGPNASAEDVEAVKYLMSEGYISTISSSDGRTQNVKSVNVLELLPSGASASDLLNGLDSTVAATLDAEIGTTITTYGDLYARAYNLLKVQA